LHQHREAERLREIAERQLEKATDPLDETGVPLGVQQKLMRHANISTTMNVYGGAFMESKRKANTSVVQRVFVQDRTK
jgi:integrase